MKRITKIFVYLTILTGLLTACQDEFSKSQAIVENEVRSGGRKVRSEISIVPMENHPATKSVYAGSETEVRNWTLLQFDGELPGGEGRLVAAYYQNSSSNISNIVVRPDHKYNFYAVANLGDVRSEFTVSASTGTTEAQLLSWIATKDYSSGSAKAITMPNVAALPMAGKQTAVSFTAAQLRESSTHVELNMTRLVGRYDIVVNQSGLSKWSFTASSLEMKGTSSVMPFQASSCVSMAQVAGDRASADDLSNLNGGRQATFYPLENCYGNLLSSNTQASGKTAAAVAAVSSSATPTYVELKGTLTMTDGSDISRAVTYRFYLGDGDNATTKNFDVFRNKQHTLTVYLTDAALDDPYWKVEPEPYTDTRVLEFTHDVIPVVLGSSADEPIIRTVNGQPKNFQYTIVLGSALANANVKVKVGGSDYVAGTPVDVSTITVDASSTTTFVQGPIQIWTLDGAIHDEATVAIGKQLLRVSIGLWPNSTTEKFHSDTTITYVNSYTPQYFYPHLYAHYSDGSTSDVTPAGNTGYTFESSLFEVADGQQFKPLKAGTGTIGGSYTEDGITKSATANVVILHGEMSNFKIMPQSVELLSGGTTQQFTPYAIYEGESDWAELSAEEKTYVTWDTFNASHNPDVSTLFSQENGLATTLLNRGKGNIRAHYVKGSVDKYASTDVTVYSELVSLAYRPEIYCLPAEIPNPGIAYSGYTNDLNFVYKPLEVVAIYHDGSEDIVSSHVPTDGEWTPSADLTYAVNFVDENDTDYPYRFYICDYVSGSQIRIGAAKGNSGSVRVSYSGNSWYLNSGQPLSGSVQRVFHHSTYTYRGVTKEADFKVTADAAIVPQPVSVTITPMERTMLVTQSARAAYVATIEFSDGHKIENVASETGLSWSISGVGSMIGVDTPRSAEERQGLPNGVAINYAMMFDHGDVIGDATITATYTYGSTTISGTALLHVVDPGTLLDFFVDPDRKENCEPWSSHGFIGYAKFSNGSYSIKVSDSETVTFNSASNGYINVSKYTVWTMKSTNFGEFSNGYDVSSNKWKVTTSRYYGDYCSWDVSFTHDGVTKTDDVYIANMSHDYGPQTGLRLERKEGSNWVTADATIAVGSSQELRAVEVYQNGTKTTTIYNSMMFTNPSDPSSLITWTSLRERFTANAVGEVTMHLEDGGFTSNSIKFTITSSGPDPDYYDCSYYLAKTDDCMTDVDGNTYEITSGETITFLPVTITKIRSSQTELYRNADLMYTTPVLSSTAYASVTDVTVAKSDIGGGTNLDGDIQRGYRVTGANTTSSVQTVTLTINWTAGEFGHDAQSESVTIRINPATVPPQYKYQLRIGATPPTQQVGSTVTLSATRYQSISTDGGSTWGDWTTATDVTSSTTFSVNPTGTTGAATISGSTATGTAEGKTVITGSYSAVSPVEVVDASVTWSNIPVQTQYRLEIGATPTSATVGSSVNLSAMLKSRTSSDGGSTWSDWSAGTDVTTSTTFSRKSGAAVTISGSTATGTEAGTTVITGSYTGVTVNEVVDASVTWTAPVYEHKLELSASPIRIEVGTKSTLTLKYYTRVQGTSDWGTGETVTTGITWSTTSHGAISGMEYTGTSKGSDTFTATYSGTTSNNAEITVFEYEHKLVVSADPTTIAVGGESTLSAMYQTKASDQSSWDSGTNVTTSATWEGNNHGSISGSKYIGTSTGTDNLTATYQGVSDGVSITVVPKELDHIEFADGVYTLQHSNSYTGTVRLIAYYNDGSHKELSPSDNVSFSSQNNGLSISSSWAITMPGMTDFLPDRTLTLTAIYEEGGTQKDATQSVNLVCSYEVIDMFADGEEMYGTSPMAVTFIVKARLKNTYNNVTRDDVYRDGWFYGPVIGSTAPMTSATISSTDTSKVTCSWDSTTGKFTVNNISTEDFQDDEEAIFSAEGFTLKSNCNRLSSVAYIGKLR